MADREQPYDPYIPAGGNAQGGAQGQSGNHRTAALQAVRRYRPLSRCAPAKNRWAMVPKPSVWR